jgi:hypothetical protein
MVHHRRRGPGLVDPGVRQSFVLQKVAPFFDGLPAGPGRLLSLPGF